MTEKTESGWKYIRDLGILGLVAAGLYYGYRYITGAGLLGVQAACPAGTIRMAEDCQKNYSGIAQTLCFWSSMIAGNPCVTDPAASLPTGPHGCNSYEKWCEGLKACILKELTCYDPAPVIPVIPIEKDPHGCTLPSIYTTGTFWCPTLAACVIDMILCPDPVVDVPIPVPDPSCNAIGWACRDRGCCTQQEHDAYHAKCLAPNQIDVYPICAAATVAPIAPPGVGSCPGGAILWSCPTGWLDLGIIMDTQHCCMPK